MAQNYDRPRPQAAPPAASPSGPGAADPAHDAAAFGLQDALGTGADHGPQDARPGAPGAPPPADPGAALAAATAGPAQKLPYQAEMEAAFATDFSDVRAFTGQAGAMAALGAQAATTGNTVVFAEEQPDKSTVAHELAHIVQGRGAGSAGGSGSVSSAADPSEQEAKRVGDAAASGTAPPVQAAPSAAIHREEPTTSTTDTGIQGLNEGLAAGDAQVVFHAYGTLGASDKMALFQDQAKFVRVINLVNGANPGNAEMILLDAPPATQFEVSLTRNDGPHTGRAFMAMSADDRGPVFADEAKFVRALRLVGGPQADAMLATAPAPVQLSVAVALPNGPACVRAWAAATNDERTAFAGDAHKFMLLVIYAGPAGITGILQACSPDLQFRLAADVMAMIMLLASGTHPTVAMPALLTDSNRTATIATGNPILAVALFNDEATFKPLTDTATGAGLEAWIRLLVAFSKGAWILKWAGPAAAKWAPAVKNTSTFATILTAGATPPTAEEVAGLWSLWDGQAYEAAVTLALFHRLYNKDIEPAGTVHTYPGPTNLLLRPHTPAWNTQPLGRYDIRNDVTTVMPNGATLEIYLRRLRPLPARDVAAAASIGFAAEFVQKAKRTVVDPTEAGATPDADFSRTLRTLPMTTSYYMRDNRVLMRVEAVAGTSGATTEYQSNPGMVGTGWDGKARAVGGGRTGSSLTVFQNHAQHEVGHAVGARSFPDIGSGNAMARSWAKWDNSDAASLQAAYWRHRGPVHVPVDGVNTTFQNADVAAYAQGIIENGQAPAGNPITAIPYPDLDKLQALAVQSGNSTYLLYAKLVLNDGPSLAYVMGSPLSVPGDTVHIRSTRGAPYMKYAKNAMTTMSTAWGWYSLASPQETFAEMYTKKYSSGQVPPALNGVDAPAWFSSLERIPDQVFNSAPVDAPADGPGVGAGGTEPAGGLDGPAGNVPDEIPGSPIAG